MTPLLEARSLSAGYGRRPVVKDVSLALHAGRTLALVGPNAAGKTTLLHALAGALPAQEGEVLLSGEAVERLGAKERARRLALVPQSARHDVDFTVRELVALGRTPHAGPWGMETAADREAIERAVVAADLSHVRDRPFSALSGGERQRTLFARALAQGSPVLLLDEPTAHLDLGHQLLMLDLVAAHASSGGAALVVLHDLALAARLDEVAVLAGGSIAARGAPGEVLTAALLKEVWGVEGTLEQGGPGPALRLAGRVARAEGEA